MSDIVPARDRLVSLADTVYVADRCLTVYVQVFKAACTTMLWTLLELEGYDAALLDRSTRGDIPTAELLVHDRTVYPVPIITEVGPSKRREALTSPDWLRVAVLRDPYARLYSAWESKLLLADPGPWLEMGAPPLTVNDNGIDVGASFRAFVADLAARPATWMGEPHFATQASMVRVDEISYTDLVPTSQLGALISRLSKRSGIDISPRRSNEGLGLPWPGFIDAPTAAAIESLYVDDFGLTGTAARSFELGPAIYLDDAAMALRYGLIARGRRALQLGELIESLSNPDRMEAEIAPRRRKVWRL